MVYIAIGGFQQRVVADTFFLHQETVRIVLSRLHSKGFQIKGCICNLNSYFDIISCKNSVGFLGKNTPQCTIYESRSSTTQICKRNKNTLKIQILETSIFPWYNLQKNSVHLADFFLTVASQGTFVEEGERQVHLHFSFN